MCIRDSCKGEPQVIDGVSMLDPLTGKSWMLGSSMKIRVAAADVALGLSLIHIYVELTRHFS